MLRLYAGYSCRVLRRQVFLSLSALLACLGPLPAAMSTGVGSNTQKPFAIVVVTGLLSRLFLGFFVSPVLYEMVASEGNVLQV